MLVTTTYLEQRSPDDIRPAKAPAEPIDVVRAENPTPEFTRFLYATVGGDWFWVDRLTWSHDQWVERLAKPMVEVWVAWSGGTPAGYVEFIGRSAEDTAVTSDPAPPSTSDTIQLEIASFGLLPGFLGRGIGGHLLTVGCQRAWSVHERWPGVPPVGRVWLHTCSLDGPAALGNYQARGFTPYHTKQTDEAMPPRTPGSWPGPSTSDGQLQT
ncbi:hypothetical protein EV193_101128 [Herbihabitans rhizosphaerae]|uniref:N-acetyltransferase domain-containing protein n=1 Tax=Herbihabitans rhizosphaerae TaxID=1872711 RepID=A0A4V2EUE1_9PSEU|nr:GNAT family N-acetyltransferase [Herbihabitans rhizosphaerae]RZS44253.1 hypothetical protein EV193_101128 [Herbihabitans rhizosphaerae]